MEREPSSVDKYVSSCLIVRGLRWTEDLGFLMLLLFLISWSHDNPVLVIVF